MTAQDAALVFMGLAFLLMGILVRKFNWTYGVAMKKGPPAPFWLGRLVFFLVGAGMVLFDCTHLVFGWADL